MVNNTVENSAQLNTKEGLNQENANQLEELNNKENTDKETMALVSYNKNIHRDKKVENILMPIRDGLMICRKVSN